MHNDTNTAKKHTYPFMNGAVAGVVEVLFTHPIDVYKTRLQSQLANKHFDTRPKHTSVHRCIQLHYNGFGARLCAVVPMRLTFWGVQDICNTHFQTHTTFTPIMIGALSGIITGCAQTIVDAPTEWLKIQRITNTTPSSSAYSSAIRKLVNYRYIPGFSPTLYRNIIVVCCLNTGLLCYGNATNAEHLHTTPFAVGVVSSLVGSFISHPFDVVKTSMQRANTPRRTMRSWFRMYYRTNPLSLWTGVIPRCSQVMLSMGIGSVVFYGMKQHYYSV